MPFWRAIALQKARNNNIRLYRNALDYIYKIFQLHIMKINDYPPSQQRLSKYISKLLGGTLGSGFSPFRKQIIEQPKSVAGLIYSSIYLILFYLVPKLVWNHNNVLVQLSLWRGVYLFLCTWVVRVISPSVEALIKDQLIPRLSSETNEKILSDLEKRFPRFLNFFILPFIAVLTGCLSIFLVKIDLPNLGQFESIWWTIGYSIIYFFEIQSVNICSFYISFSDNLKLEKESLYPLNPMDTDLVIIIQLIGQRILLHWLDILVLTIPPIFIFGDVVPNFLIYMVPIGSLFSILFGTFIYFKSEQNIKNSTNHLIFEVQDNLEKRIIKLLKKIDKFESKDWENLSNLISLRRDLKPSNSILNTIPSILSVIVPLVGPIIAILTLSP